MGEKVIQLSSGSGPAECERVVVLLLNKIREAAGREQIHVEVIEVVPGKPEHTDPAGPHGSLEMDM